MDDKTQQSKPNISVATWILVFIVCLFFDALSLIPGVGDVEDVPGAIIFLLNLIMGVGGVILMVQGVVMFLKALPFVQEIPWWTMGAITVLIAEKVPVLKPALQVAQKATEVESGNVGELGENAAAAKGAATAESAAAKGGIKGEVGTAANGKGAETTEGAAARESGAATKGEDEASQAPSGEESSPLDEEGGNAMKNLQEGLLEPAPEGKEPEAALPYQKDELQKKDNVVKFPEAQKEMDKAA